MREMRGCCLQVLLAATLVAASWGHLLDADGYQHWRYNFPLGPHPLVAPPEVHHLPPPRAALPPLFHLQAPPPPQVIIVPLHVRASFPPFVERIVQRIQTWWSFYNPPEYLTRPPPTADSEVPTTNSPKKNPITLAPTTTPVPKQEAVTEAATEAATEAEEAETTTTAPTSDSSVSTLAVFEVTPSTSAQTEDTEEPLLITPEKASLLGGQREAYLRFLQTGTLPPYLESINDMED